MGTYFNPDNGSFIKARRSKNYIDKTGLLEFLNERLNTEENCISVSHARRFGKSHAAGMIDAYYSCGSDSYELFKDTEIAKMPDFEDYLNKYNVIHLDIASFWDFHKDDLIEEIHKRVCKDFKKVYGDKYDYDDDLYLLINEICEDGEITEDNKKVKKPFIIIIDEWDCLIREGADKPELVQQYLQFLHSLFKSEESKSFLALAYITGILPIKKVKGESALNNFEEYTMIESTPIAEYFGFTGDEVKELCNRYHMDFESAQKWYNGYHIDGMHMYNPNSIVRAINKKKFDSYWKNTSSFESINTFITMNFDGLKDDILKMLAGGTVMVNTGSFKNDLSVINSKDDALTALIHLGYLGYDADKKSAYIPNYEVATAFESALITGGWSDVASSISRCDEILFATINNDADKVAEILEIAHETYTSILKYNDENSLSCAITMAYFTAPAYYNVIRELPSGKGFADFAFIPRSNAGNKPAMIIELKYDKSADTAINQIKDNRYTGELAGYGDRLLLVGVNYDKDGDKKHSCVIEECKPNICL